MHRESIFAHVTARLRRAAWLPLGLAALSLTSLGCRHHYVKQTAYAGDGNYTGSPPMCFQHREESRPTSVSRTLLVHFNNTCSFPIECSVYNDVTEAEQEVRLFQGGRYILLVSGNSDAKRFDVELDCTWQG
jgi:hypothetical protein